MGEVSFTIVILIFATLFYIAHQLEENRKELESLRKETDKTNAILQIRASQRNPIRPIEFARVRFGNRRRKSPQITARRDVISGQGRSEKE